MDAVEYQFRTAAFGGFQKQDVLSYLETSAREHAERVAALEQELEECRRRCEELEKRCAEEQELGDVLTARCQRLEEEGSAKDKALDEVREKDRRLAEQETTIAQLREKLRRAEPSAAAYESIKDRTAGVELEAHHRARLIEDQAREKAQAVGAALEDWLGRVQAGYQRLRTDVDATLTHASGELERVSKSLGGLSSDFDEYDAALAKLMEDAHTPAGPQPPQPLPLDGE